MTREAADGGAAVTEAAVTKEIEYFFDPVCPFAWITSRWVTEVQQRRDLKVTWRFISLAMVNEKALDDSDAAVAAGGAPTMPTQYRSAAELGRRLLRVAAAVRDQHGNDAVWSFYTAAGELLHPGGRAQLLWTGEDPGDVVGDALERSGLSADLAQHADDDELDAVLRAETDLALSRTGPDVGTPIITFDTARADQASLFGPVLSRIPRDEEALELWDAVSTIATTAGVSEFKRSLRAELAFD